MKFLSIVVFVVANTVYCNAQEIIVPVAGNTWSSIKNRRTVSNSGIRNWNDPSESFTTYVRVSNPGNMSVRIVGNVPDGKSELAIIVVNKKRKLALNGNSTNEYRTGTWAIKDTGYVPLKISGIKKSGKYFAEIESLKLSGTAINEKTSYVKNNEGNFFYWGRRGPSTHMGYALPANTYAEWFYNEVTVPEGNDIIGSYFMANGFAEGYFGIQVNSEKERRVLFSVWSPFSTDNPKDIPEDQKIVLLKKGENVQTGEFGNEGSGGQSFLRYNWKAGNTYKFLLHGVPDDATHTTYTAYFFAPEQNKWMLIASFKRPKTSTYLRGLHSFLENFSPDYGDLERRVYFGNQWMRDAKGNWQELTNGRFTADNTARIGYRKDYSGGAEGNRFYLHNFGFFKNYTPIGTTFQRTPNNKPPMIDFNDLP